MDVTLDDGDLVIKGERKSELEVKEEQHHRMERSFGICYRWLPLPEGVASDAIQATYTDGVLEVQVPKPTATGSRGTTRSRSRSHSPQRGGPRSRGLPIRAREEQEDGHG